MLRQPLTRLSSLGKVSTNVHFNAARSMASKSPRDLTGRVAIVTASSDGIGLAIAKRLAEDGAKVMISSRKEKNVQKALELLYGSGISKDNVKGVVCHVGNQEDRTNLINSTVSNFGGIDILVSNAATNPVMGPMLDCPENAWDKIFEVNVKAPFLLSNEVVPHLEKRKGSNILYISSIGGLHPFALIENEAIHDKMMEIVPLGRVGEPPEIAGLVSFLVSDDASYITGETYVAAGGQPSRL